MIRLKIRSRQRISPRARIVLFSTAGLLVASGIFFLIANLGHQEKAIAAFGMHGIRTVTTTNVIVNEYTTLTSNANSGATTINVSNSGLNTNGRFSANLTAGELLMIVQMNETNVSTTNSSLKESKAASSNSGNFEFVEVLSVQGNKSISLANGLARSYSVDGLVQVIRVPRYSSFTVNKGASLTCPAWNGSTGGILAIENTGASVIDGMIDVSAKGFQGKSVGDASTLVALENKNSISNSPGRIQFGEGGADANTREGAHGGVGGGIIYLLNGKSVSGTGSLIANGESVATTDVSAGSGGTLCIYTSAGSVSGVSLVARGGSVFLERFNSNSSEYGSGNGGCIAVTNPAQGLIRNVTAGKCLVFGSEQNAKGIVRKAIDGKVINSLPNPLTTGPIKNLNLKSVEARPENGMVHLEWLTISETNTGYFTVERSQDGINYIRLSVINAAGNSNSELYYDWMDEHPSPGINYYRLSQTGTDGKSKSYNPLAIKMDGSAPESLKIYTVYPNPFSTKLSGTFSEPAGSGILSLVNTDAQVVRSEKILSGKKEFNINQLDDIPSGTYYLCFVSNNKKIAMQKVVKQ